MYKAITLLLLTSMASLSVAAEVVASNPFYQHDALYVGQHGVARFEVGSTSPSWHVLNEVATLEPVVTQQTVLIGSSNGLYALSTLDGSVRWLLPAQSTIFSPTLVDGIAYAGGVDGVLRAIRVDSGEIIWQQQLTGWVYAPAMSDGVVVTGGSAERLWGVDARSGKILWQRPLSGELVFRPQSTLDGGVAVTTFAGEVMVREGQNGRLRWRRQTPAAAISLAVRKDQLFVGGFDGRLTTYGVTTGTRQWQHIIGGRLPYRQQFAGNVTIIGNDQGVVDVLETATGRRLHHLRLADEGIGRPLLINGHVVRFKFDRFSKEYSVESVLLGSGLQL